MLYKHNNVLISVFLQVMVYLSIQSAKYKIFAKQFVTYRQK